MKAHATIASALFAASSLIATACGHAPSTGKAFSHDWAHEQRRVTTQERLEARELYVLGEKVRPPSWLKVDEDPRAEVPISKTNNRSMSFSVNQEEAGVRWSWGPRPTLPPPPGADASAQPPAPESRQAP